MIEKDDKEDFEGGYSVVQLMIGIAIGGGLLALPFWLIPHAPSQASQHRLTADVRTVNAALSVHRIFRGSSASDATPAEVLGSLQEESKSIPNGESSGLGRSIANLARVLELKSGAEISGARMRAAWNRVEQRFEMVPARAPGLVFVQGSGWILESAEGSAPEADGFVETGSVVAAAETSLEKRLAAPTCSIPGGEYPVSDFDLRVRIIDPNPEGSSRVRFSMGGSPWQVYDGVVLTVAPGTTIEVLAESLVPELGASPASEIRYTARNARLLPPVIGASAARFDFGSGQVVEVTLTNPNKSEISRVEYRTKMGPWKTYDGPLNLGVFNYRERGAKIEARVVPLGTLYQRSDVALTQIEAPRESMAFTGSAADFSNSNAKEPPRDRTAAAIGSPF